MGGFGSVLGNAVGGFEQARQQDLARQFEDEQNRRAQIGGFLQKIAMDETAHPYTRNAAVNEYLNLAQTPYGKKYKFDPNTLVAPPTPQGGAPGGQAAPATSAPPMPPSFSLGAGDISLPPPPPSAAAGAGAPPAPPSVPAGQGNVFMTPEEQTGMLAQRGGAEAGAVAGSTLQAQMATRKAQYASLPGFSNLPPETQAVLIGGGSLLPLMRTTGTGGGFAGQLRSQGFNVPANIKDDQWVDMRQMGGGQITFVPGAGPGQKAGENGQLMGPLAFEQAKQTIDLPFYHQKIGMQLAKSLSLQQNAFNLAIQSGALKQADQIYGQNWSDLKQRQGALSLMEQNYQQALQGNQQAMVSLLFNHMGMTSGAVKGTRMSRATVEEAMQSTPWLQGVVAKWFHQDQNGDYIFDGLKGGVNLTKPQMEQMMELARDRVAVQRQVLDTMSQAPGFDASTAVPPGVSAVGGFTATKKISAPPKPPSGGGNPPAPPPGAQAAGTPDPYEGRTATGPNGHKIKRTKGQWVDAVTGAPLAP